MIWTAVSAFQQNPPGFPSVSFMRVQVLTNTFCLKFQFFPTTNVNNSHALWYNEHSPRWKCWNARTHRTSLLLLTSWDFTAVIMLSNLQIMLPRNYDTPSHFKQKKMQMCNTKLCMRKVVTLKLTRIFTHLKHFPWGRKYLTYIQRSRSVSITIW